jgi:hypothetical protein
MVTRRPLTFRIFDPEAPSGGRDFRQLTLPVQPSPEAEAARLKRAKRLADLRQEGEELKAKITDPVARAGLRRIVSGV